MKYHFSDSIQAHQYRPVKYTQHFCCHLFVKLISLLLLIYLPFSHQAHAQWSIGIYEGDSPLALQPTTRAQNPVLTAADVTDVTANFVADPFIIPVGSTWYMFFEILNAATNQGDIGYATSPDGVTWTYQQVVLDEGHHLSFPYVFEWLGEYYMIPESGDIGTVTLYKATSFPTNWTPVSNLLTGVGYRDASVFYYNSVWWMFVSPNNNDTLQLFYADDLLGPWTEHPASPIISGDANIARSAGRVIDFGGRLLRMAQDDAPTYGNQVRAFEITELTKTSYAEIEVVESPLFGATGVEWNRDGMHQLDAWQTSLGTWLGSVDGFGDPTQIVNKGMPKTFWSLLAVDSQELVGEDGAAVNAFDGNANTIWHTEWSNGSPPPPHHIDIDLGIQYNIDGFVYIPRQDGGSNGNIGDYEFYVSLDGINWGSPVTTGTFTNDANPKEVRFPATPARYIRLRALTEASGNPWTVIGELNVIAANADSGNYAPNVMIDTPASTITIDVGNSVNFTATGTDPDADYPLTYHWTFGTGSGVSDSTLEDPGFVRFDIPGTYTVLVTTTDANGTQDLTPAVATVIVQDPTASSPISQASWSLMYVDSEELAAENGAAINAFDGDPATIWHTEWSAGSPTPPHTIEIYLGNQFTLDGFRYLPRQDGGINGRIGTYEVYVSLDGVTWGSPVASGSFANDDSEKEVRFAPVEAQYVRLRALTEVNSNPWTVVAELNFLGSLSSSANFPPDCLIDLPTSDVSINIGDSIDFYATGTDAEGDFPLTYQWDFGTGSGISPSTLEDPGLVQFDTAGKFTVTCTVTDSAGLTDRTPASRTVTVIDPSAAPPIPQTDWTLYSVDSQELLGEDGAAINAFDGDVTTIWHTEWSAASPSPPHEIVINLGLAYDVDGFSYTPRQDGGVNGRIADYEFSVSLDAVNWTIVATGTFANDGLIKEVRFGAATGQYVRLRALSEVNGNPWTAAAEIQVMGLLAAGVNLPPDGVIDSPASDTTITAGQTVDFFATGSDIDGDTPLTFAWTFGTGSGVADSTQESPGTIQFDVPGTYTVTFTVTDAQGLADPTPATRTITVLDPLAGTPISQVGWSLFFVDSEETAAENGAAVNAFDGNPATIWHTDWSSSSPPPPHTIEIDLGTQYNIDGLSYLPRQDGGINGTIADYEIYVSTDGINWGAPLATGKYTADTTEKVVRFTPTTGQFIRLRAMTEINGNPWTSVAEIQVMAR